MSGKDGKRVDHMSSRDFVTVKQEVEAFPEPESIESEKNNNILPQIEANKNTNIIPAADISKNDNNVSCLFLKHFNFVIL